MSTTAVPEGWFTITAKGVAHRAESLIGDAVRPVCSMAETPGGQTRPPHSGDQVCRSCVRELVDAAIDLNLPLVECLYCGQLESLDGGRVLAEHTALHEIGDTSHDDEQPSCCGSGMPPARHDERDQVRREAVISLAMVRGRLRTQRFHLSQGVERGIPLPDAIRHWGYDLVRFEALEHLWGLLLSSGDYLTGVHAAISLLLPHDNDAVLPAFGRDAREAATREWLAASGPRIGDALSASDNAGRVAELARSFIALAGESPRSR